ncbi:MAG: purine-nucleoside phosphorylase [Acidobacteriota bacterium]
MDHLERELGAAVAAWEQRGWPRPDAMVVSGSGLATDLGRLVEGPHGWADLLPFPVSGIVGHPLTLELLEPVPGRVVLSSRGRLHAYQGYTLAQVVFPIRLAALLGARVLLMTNSSGGVDATFRPGDLMLVEDHLNLSGGNALWGAFPEQWGPQFPDMMHAYDPGIQELIRQAAGGLGLELKCGVYAGLGGPSYETPAEVRMLRTLGADAVGMSTVNEVIAAHHMGLRCGVISVISNPGAGVTDEILDHQDVLDRARSAGLEVAKLFGELLRSSELC